MKKSIALILSLVALFSCYSLTAAAYSENEMTPYYNNASLADATISISSSGKATIKLTGYGISGVTSKITAVSYIQRKIGLIWVRVDNGLSGKEWTDTVNGTNLTKTHTLQLSKPGTYRVKAEFTFYGSGGSADKIVRTASDAY